MHGTDEFWSPQKFAHVSIRFGRGVVELNISWSSNLALAGAATPVSLDLSPEAIPPDRARHPLGDGPFARLKMPPLPDSPGLYIWEVDGTPMYVGQTRTPLKKRLGSNGYSTISNYNTFARQPGRTNGGQQTNYRINAIANQVLVAGEVIRIWYRVTKAEDAGTEESLWMREFGVPPWNRRDER